MTAPSEAPRLRALRLLLAADALVLLFLGASFVLAPGQLLALFRFDGLPAGVGYLMGLWGCVLATLAIGYAAAALDPVRHVVWVQVGIARGLLECGLGAVCVARGIVTWEQAGLGTVVAGVIAAAYLALYPRNS